MKQNRKKERSSRRTDQKLPPASASITPAGSKRQWLFRLLALVLLPLVTFAFLEIILQLAGYGYPTGFFKKSIIDGQEYLLNNEAYGSRFFPAELARFSGPIRIAAHKPADTFRIFILGESAAMGDPEPSFGASRYLEVLLRERFPQQKFEIVNVAITAINSHVILPIARDCAEAQGNLWIIYMGNNEMVGPFGAATVFGAQAPPVGLVRLSLAIQKTRTGQLLMSLAQKLRSRASSATSWGGMEMFVGNRLPPDAPRKETVYHNYERNLRDIVSVGLESGAKVVLNTVAVNLKDCPPFASLANTNLPAADTAQLEKFYVDALNAVGASNYASATRLFEQAAKLDPKNADLQYRWGLSLLAETNFTAARGHLQLACDVDALPFRTDSRINDLIREEGRKRAGDQLVLLDAASILATNEPAGVCGQETFYEHVHFNFDGNYRLGRLWAEETEKVLPVAVSAKPAGPWASAETCDRLLGLSLWNRALVLQALLRRLAQPPLSSQFNNADRRHALEAQVKEIRQQMNANTAATARMDFEEALKHAPNDHYLHEVYGGFLQSTGDLPGATREWKRVRELLPQDFLSEYQLGRLYAMQGQWTNAEVCLNEVVAAHPGMIEAWCELGDVASAQGAYERALAHFEEGRKRRPRDPRILTAMGKALAKSQRRPEAIARFREAIQASPDYWDAHFELAGELSYDEKIPEALAEFAETVRLQPANPRGHFNLGVMYAKQQRYEEAEREFAETLRLEPANQTAATYLAQIKQLQAPAKTRLSAP